MFWDKLLKVLPVRINRYIVGCKSELDAQYYDTELGINRYIVGCKLYTNTSITRTFNRINRYIVGCKYAGR